jgi:hypothetical protein
MRLLAALYRERDIQRARVPTRPVQTIFGQKP